MKRTGEDDLFAARAGAKNPSRSVLVNLADSVRAQLAHRHLHLPPGSRFDQHCRTLGATAQVVTPSGLNGLRTKTNPALRAALLDVAQLAEILSLSDRWDGCASFQEKLETILKDPAVPSTDMRAQSRGRDAQVELWTLVSIPEVLKPRLDAKSDRPAGTELRKGPDILIDLGRLIGIEVKRLKSVGQLEKRVAQATDQLVAASRIGAVAIDFSASFEVIDGISQSIDPIDAVATRLNANLDQLVTRWSDSPTLFWLFGHALVFVRTSEGEAGPLGAWVRRETAGALTDDAKLLREVLRVEEFRTGFASVSNCRD